MTTDFEKEKVFWTRKMNVKLVKFIESHPNIWNPKHHKYTSVEARDQIYSEFALKYGNVFSGKAVKERWTNIRSTFANYLRKVIASRAKMDGEEYKVNWHLWEPCKFLLKVSKKKKCSTFKEDNTEDVTNDIDESVLEPKENWSSGEENYTNDDAMDGSSCQTIAENLVEMFKSVQNDAFGLDNTENGKVGRIVAKKLSEMNSYDAAVTSQKIMDILLLYNEYSPMNPNYEK